MNKIYVVIIAVLFGVTMNANADKKEWKDEPGYCNCLLVTMARAKINEIEINSKYNVPNLEELAKNIPDTLEWIRAQGFNYPKLNSSIVIEILCDSAEMKTSLFGGKTGIINVHDAQKDNGPIVQRKYHLKLNEIKDVTVLNVRLENK